MYRDSLGNVYWKTRAERLTALLEDEVKELAAIPSVVIVERKTEMPPAPSAPPEAADSASAESAGDTSKSLAVAALRAPGAGEKSSEKNTEKSAEKKAEEAAVRKEAEDIERVLDGIGYGKRAAREMVARALAQLATLGRPPTGEEILSTAIRGRVVVRRAPSSATAENGKSRWSREDPRGEPRPPVTGDAGAGPEGEDRIAS